MSAKEEETEQPQGEPKAVAAARSSSHATGPRCPQASLALLLLAVVLYVFGVFYVLDPSASVASIQGVATGIGLKLPAPPSEPSGYFYGWIGFTFAYMMAAATSSFFAARSSTESRTAYLNVLLVLKGTSSFTGIVLFVSQPHYAFYLATFLTDGLIFLGVWAIRAHLLHRHPTSSAEAVSRRSE
ncbi:MAG: hypothetical protein KGJ23_01880 [Euryarchaeota archaeon]|nr:hypothetical protein [Euryarchaeota archaeon]MDE1835344.1 hypothetical protein [Euryarchaeota archaeon]MDE1880761.1 hypothetical protein [Euryarchaeota archaeon]MDE2043640.1 hypothetical protein [Thermoplasmata archaeon]